MLTHKKIPLFGVRGPLQRGFSKVSTMFLQERLVLSSPVHITSMLLSLPAVFYSQSLSLIFYSRSPEGGIPWEEIFQISPPSSFFFSHIVLTFSPVDFSFSLIVLTFSPVEFPFSSHLLSVFLLLFPYLI